MSIIRKALEKARDEMSFLNGLRVTDIPDNRPSWVIYTKDTTDLLDQALRELGYRAK